jgi:hypothetical protein
MKLYINNITFLFCNTKISDNIAESGKVTNYYLFVQTLIEDL